MLHISPLQNLAEFAVLFSNHQSIGHQILVLRLKAFRNFYFRAEKVVNSILV
jgi:hypothetical protein